jgi:hypothetical protein
LGNDKGLKPATKFPPSLRDGGNAPFMLSSGTRGYIQAIAMLRRNQPSLPAVFAIAASRRQTL